MVLNWHLKIVQLVSRNQNQFVTVRYFVSLLLKKEERERLCLTLFLLLKVLFNSYLTKPPFIRFKWANKCSGLFDSVRSFDCGVHMGFG